jgi:hypothetical protein
MRKIELIPIQKHLWPIGFNENDRVLERKLKFDADRRSSEGERKVKVKPGQTVETETKNRRKDKHKPI